MGNEWFQDTDKPNNDQNELLNETAKEDIKTIKKKRKVLREKKNNKEWQVLTNGEELPPSGEYYQFPNYFYAGFWIRFFAFMVDIIMIACLNKILWRSLFQLSADGKMYFVCSTLVYLLYFILMTKLTNGQTLGKMIFGIKVICFKEKELSWSTVLVREGACRFIFKLSFLFLCYVSVIITGKKQHFGDLFADTSVVTLNMIKAYQRLEV